MLLRRRQKGASLLTQASQIRQGSPLAVRRPLGRTVLCSDATRPDSSFLVKECEKRRERKTEEMRSHAESPRDDKVSGFRGRLYGMTQSGCFINDPFRHTVIRHLALLS
jgi:hypothetical protein